MKIFIGVHEIASYYLNLHRGFVALNVESSYACIGGQRFNYGIDELAKSKRVWAYYCAFKKHTQADGGRLRKLGFKVGKWIQKTRFIIWAVYNHDTFVFGFGTSLLPNNRDLFWLKLLKKKVIINMIHGSELRPMYLNGNNLDNNGKPINTKILIEGTKRLKERAQRMEKHANVLLAGPHNCQFLTKPFINHYQIGLPVYSEFFQKEIKSDHSKITKIVHAPSNPRPKGTYIIREVIRRLKERGYAIEYTEIINKPHEQVLIELEDADLILDQVYSDCPMAGLPTEGACCGTASLVAGLNLEYIDRFIPDDKKPPTFLCNSADLETKLQEVLSDQIKLKEVGFKAKEFVENVWGFEVVADRFLALIAKRIPDDWFLNPGEVNYINGYGMNEEEWHGMLSSCVAVAGYDGLFLENNPNLQREILDQIVIEKHVT